MRVPDLGEGRQAPKQAEGRVGSQGGGGAVRWDVEGVGLITGTEGSYCPSRDCSRVLAGYDQRAELLRGFDDSGINCPATNHEALVLVILDVSEGTSDSRLKVPGVRTVDLDFEGG